MSKLIDNRQLNFERIGKEGCYFLSLVRAGERAIGRYLDAYYIYLKANELGFLGENCYVFDPVGIMQLMLGGRWAFEKQTRDYVAKPTEIVVLRFERKEGMATLAHFVLAGPDGTVEYDPYGQSKTVATGNLISKRVLWQVEKGA
jgi:hypothetical protein